MEEALKLVGQYGLPLVLVIYFVVRDSRDKSSVVKRLNETEDFVRSRLTQVIEANTQAMIGCKQSRETFVELARSEKR